MRSEGLARPVGDLGLRLVRGDGSVEDIATDAPSFPPAPLPLRPLTLPEMIYHSMPRRDLPAHVNAWRLRNAGNIIRGLKPLIAARAIGVLHVHGQLYLRVFRGDGSIDELGLASLRLVTDVGVGYIVDAFQNTVEVENMKFHGFGTGTTAEAANQTALVTELTTEYVSDNTRPTGTTTEGASANIYRTVATLDPDADVAITEHGVFSASSAGVLLDRSKFSAVNLVGSTGDTLQATYELTFASGG